MTNYSPGQALLAHALRIEALKIKVPGFELKSGRVSPHFFDAGLFTTGKSLDYLAAAYAAKYFEFVREQQFHSRPVPDVLFGPAYKGIPLVTALAMKIYQDTEHGIGWAFNRKEAKDHGEGGLIVGASLKGRHVLLIDDVMTSGMSSSEAFRIVADHGGYPVGGLLAFDRQERGLDTEFSAVQEFQSTFGIPVLAAANLDDLITVLTDRNQHVQVAHIERYREQYGA